MEELCDEELILLRYRFVLLVLRIECERELTLPAVAARELEDHADVFIEPDLKRGRPECGRERVGLERRAVEGDHRRPRAVSRENGDARPEHA
jgi:hypothetical protein